MPYVEREVGAVLAFIVGACAGSFVGVVAYRLPREISIISPPSFCPHCRRPIPWWANVPILGYIALRGRCLLCGAPLPLRDLIAELALAVAAMYLYLDFSLPQAAARFIFCAALYTVGLIDYEWRLIPNLVTFAGIPLGLLAATFLIPEVGWKSSLAGMLIGAGGLFLTGEAYRLLRGREGVGMGDVWLLGMIGAFLGWVGVVFTLFFGSLLGAIGGMAVALTRPESAQTAGGGGSPEPVSIAAEGEMRQEKSALLTTAVPFGPFLALAAGAFALFQPQFINWFFSG